MRTRTTTRIMSKFIEDFKDKLKPLNDLKLLMFLRAEINYEISSTRFQDAKSGDLGDFEVDWDSSKSRDVVLRRKFESGEEVVVSALLAPLLNEEEIEVQSLPRNMSMKICGTKPGLRSALQFDCEAYKKGNHGSEFNIHNAFYLQSLTGFSNSAYQGPSFSDLDPRLKEALKEYLESKGVGESLTNFLLLHLHKKEQGQYVDWLKKLEASVLESE